MKRPFVCSSRKAHLQKGEGDTWSVRGRAWNGRSAWLAAIRNYRKQLRDELPFTWMSVDLPPYMSQAESLKAELQGQRIHGFLFLTDVHKQSCTNLYSLPRPQDNTSYYLGRASSVPGTLLVISIPFSFSNSFSYLFLASLGLVAAVGFL